MKALHGPIEARVHPHLDSRNRRVNVVTDGFLRDREDQTHLSALQPDVLQLIVNRPVTSDAIEEPSEAGSPQFRFEIKVQKVDILSFIRVSSKLYHSPRD